MGLAVSVAILWAFHVERIEGPASPEEVKWVDSLLRSGVSLIHHICSHNLFRLALRFLSKCDLTLESARSTSFWRLFSLWWYVHLTSIKIVVQMSHAHYGYEDF